MCEPLEPLEFCGVREDYVGQTLSVDHTVDHDRRPRLGHRSKGLPAGLEHPVPHFIGIDHSRPPGTQQFTDCALAGAYPTGEQNPDLPSRHDEGLYSDSRWPNGQTRGNRDSTSCCSP